MIELLFSDPLTFFVLFPSLLLSLSFHEFAHAWVADRLGDPTPRYQGRVTLDPRAHLDPLGVLALLLTRFGWGRPVEFDPYNLKNPVRDSALIALAGPASNLSIAVVLSLIIRTGLLPNLWWLQTFDLVLTINIVLAVFNLVPVHPLDGSRILTALLPASTAHEYEEFMRRYGLFVLLLLIVPWQGHSAISQLVLPIVGVIRALLFI
jgi:Zn-dependent protease